VIEQLKRTRKLGRRCRCRPTRYLNNVRVFRLVEEFELTGGYLRRHRGSGAVSGRLYAHCEFCPPGKTARRAERERQADSRDRKKVYRHHRLHRSFKQGPRSL
jgi:hypothetical protein